MQSTVGVIFLVLTSFSFGFSQCIIDQEIIIPPTHNSRFNDFGQSNDTFEDYLVVGEQGNDSLELQSGAVHVYKLTPQNKYTKIATLSPSDPQEHLMFGQLVVIEENTIITIGRHYDNDGNVESSLYVFEKLPTSEWTTSTESYTMNADDGLTSINSFAFKSGTLAVSFSEGGVVKINIYKKVSSSFLLEEQIIAPLDANGNSGSFGHELSLSEKLLAVPCDNFYNSATDSDNVGAVFVYEKIGAIWSTTPAKLEPGDRSSYYVVEFGKEVWISENTVFVSAYQSLNQATIQTAVYYYEGTGSIWVDKNEDGKFLIGGYSPSFDLAVDGDNLFMSSPNWASIDLYIKSGTSWSSANKHSSIPIPIGVGYSNSRNNILISKDHLLVSILPNTYDVTVYDRLLDFVPVGTWDNGIVQNQVIDSNSLNASGGYFGSDISIFGNRMAIAAPSDQEIGEVTGAVFIFNNESNGWNLEQKIVSPEGRVADQFGAAIEFGGDSTLFVSALSADSLNTDGTMAYGNIGAVYIFYRSENGWEYKSKILAPTIIKEGNFGRDIAYANGYLVVSEFYDRDTEHNGLVHIYIKDKSDWNYQATLRPSEKIRHDFFGRSIAMDDSTIVVGTGNPEVHIAYNMKVYVYTKKGEWIDAYEDAQLLPNAKLKNDLFGYTVALHKNEIVVGAPGYSLTNYYGDQYFIGSAYLFQRPETGWNGIVRETAQFLPSDPFKYDTFGYAVAMDDSSIYIGAPSTYMRARESDTYDNSDNKMRSGKVYKYIKNGEWGGSITEDATISSVQPEWKDGFGAVIKVSDGTLIVGVPLDDTDSGISTGSVQTFNAHFDGLTSNAGVNNKCDYESKNLFLETNSNQENYSWYFKEDDDEEYQFLISQVDRVNVIDPGRYFVEYFDRNCGYYREYYEVNNYQSVDISIAPIPIICSEESITVIASPEGGVWSGNYITPEGLVNPTLSKNGINVVTYTLMTHEGCVYTQDKEFIVDKLEKPEVFQSSETLCVNSPVLLELIGPTSASVQWIKVGTKEEVVGNESSANINVSGIYVAEVSKHNCTSRSDELYLMHKSDSIFVPNVFTPNGDTRNDFFEIRGEGINDFSLSIHNRYGKVLFESNNPDFKWNGDGVSAGVYAWHIRYLNCAQEPKVYKGFVQVMK